MSEACALQSYVICPAGPARISHLQVPAEGLTFTFGLLRKDAQELGAQASVSHVCSAEFDPLLQCLLPALKRISCKANKLHGFWAGLIQASQGRFSCCSALDNDEVLSPLTPTHNGYQGARRHHAPTGGRGCGAPVLDH